METPLSSRRITRSQAMMALAAENTIPMSSRGENEESLKFAPKSRQKSNGGKHQEREKSALIDITNGSPIVGLAMGSLKTPSSTCSKKRMMIQNTQSKQATTPGSGESLLRGQVKTLLQKVEEEGVISKISFEHNPLIHKRFMNSPVAVLAPTPANTPQVYDFSTNNNASESFNVSPVAENFSFSQMLNEIIIEPNQEDKSDSDEKIVITRSLFMDFSEKFEGSDSPVQGSDASVWSVQVNASTSEEYKDEEDDEDYEDGDDVVVDELCEGISKISVNNDAKFTGKHIRFVYNSDGELEGEMESSSSSSSTKTASGILCLKGLPTPKGKHLRFPEENESEEERSV
ncbi:uncharacterized protein LOC112515829 [Cynara cardunculus var. scolymus]|uniref:Uncharacterized protein n=1 Tax=Cynara cardunculus var. scolymus TaxID=59895 RepID=A0A118JUD7_CYNCS|nr:uncharacterized protein LOC112515829 [Cynara cardunculus var. scolymus]KVH92304.1 hypothetical protein Ccrd_005659 [Cynara cardunculus var. scolymus]